MELFHVIEEGHAILLSKGVFKQAKIYRRGKDVYAASGGGFIKLGTGDGTSNPNIAYLGVIGPGISREMNRPPKYEAPAPLADAAE